MRFLPDYLGSDSHRGVAGSFDTQIGFSVGTDKVVEIGIQEFIPFECFQQGFASPYVLPDVFGFFLEPVFQLSFDPFAKFPVLRRGFDRRWFTAFWGRCR